MLPLKFLSTADLPTSDRDLRIGVDRDSFLLSEDPKFLPEMGDPVGVVLHHAMSLGLLDLHD